MGINNNKVAKTVSPASKLSKYLFLEVVRVTYVMHEVAKGQLSRCRCKLLHCPANPDINPLLTWPAHIAILPLFNLFFFWGVGLKSRHFNSICV